MYCRDRHSPFLGALSPRRTRHYGVRAIFCARACITTVGVCCRCSTLTVGCGALRVRSPHHEYDPIPTPRARPWLCIDPGADSPRSAPLAPTVL